MSCARTALNVALALLCAAGGASCAAIAGIDEPTLRASGAAGGGSGGGPGAGGGGTGGAPKTGGSGGMDGAMSACSSTPYRLSETPPFYLDDASDDVVDAGGLVGNWYGYPDNSGRAVRNNSMCLTRSEPGGMGVNLNSLGGNRFGCVDVSAFQGLRFVMSGTSAPGPISLQFVTAGTAASDNDGTCMPPVACDFYPAADVTSGVRATPATVSVAFRDVMPGGAAFVPTDLIRFQWDFYDTGNFDFCVTDLELY